MMSSALGVTAGATARFFCTLPLAANLSARKEMAICCFSRMARAEPNRVIKIKDMVKNLQGLDIDWGGLKDKLQGIDAGGWFQRLVNWVKGFFE